MIRAMVMAALAAGVAVGMGTAQADPPDPHGGDPNICASNPAFHNGHDADNKDKHCQDTSLNDFGGGGAPFGDRDGDGVPNGVDADSNDPGTH